MELSEPQFGLSLSLASEKIQILCAYKNVSSFSTRIRKVNLFFLIFYIYRVHSQKER